MADLTAAALRDSDRIAIAVLILLPIAMTIAIWWDHRKK